MKPTCKAEAELAYDFVDARNLRRTAHDRVWSIMAPWQQCHASTKYLQRLASKARRRAAKSDIHKILRDI